MRVEEENTLERPVRDVRIGNMPEPNRPKRRWLVLVIAGVVAAIVFVSGVLPRVKARDSVRKETEMLAVPTVSVVHPKATAPMQEIVLPANVQPYISSPIFARTNGYLKRWYADIGVHVKRGQLLAEIETPEVDQQLQQARANLATAEANLKLAEITANRYSTLLKSDSVAQQDTDNAVGSYNADKAIVAADEANVRQLEQLQSFEKIYAPFDGVITVRNTDIGALINSGSSGGTQTALFQIAQPETLRVYVNVPEAYSQAAKAGLTADLELSEFPGKRFQGKLVRTADAIDQTTRTLLVEIDVPNPTGTLLSGAYAQVHMKLPNAVTAYTLPVNTLLFRQEGLRVVVVNGGRQAELRPITMGHDFGNEVEVIAGLSGNESIIVNPPDSIEQGQEVRIASPPAPSGAAHGGTEN
jgi:RND family efflux transporter MFP subunit